MQGGGKSPGPLSSRAWACSVAERELARPGEPGCSRRRRSLSAHSPGAAASGQRPRRAARRPQNARRPPPAACAAAAGHRRGRTNVNLLFVPSPFISSQHHKEVRHPCAQKVQHAGSLGRAWRLSTAAGHRGASAGGNSAARQRPSREISRIFLRATLSLGL